MKLSLIIAIEPNPFHSKQQSFFDALLAQTLAPERFEFILVDGFDHSGEAEHFDQFRRAHPRLKMSRLHCPSRARAQGHNLGAAHASGDVLVFLADDFEPVPDLLEAHADFHELNADPNAVGIGPGLFDHALRGDPFARWMEDSGQIFGVPFRRCAGTWPRHYFYAGNASIKRDKFEALGGFDERFTTDAWDDYEFGLRLVASGGYSQVVTEAIGIHRHALTLAERYQTMLQAGAAARVLEALHPSMRGNWPWLANRSDATAVGDAMLQCFEQWRQQLNEGFRRGYLESDPVHIPLPARGAN